MSDGGWEGLTCSTRQGWRGLGPAGQGRPGGGESDVHEVLSKARLSVVRGIKEVSRSW